MSKDLVMIPAKSGPVVFNITGESEDTGLMLLQRLYVMLLSDPQTGYRDSDGGQTLLKFLDGGNIPVDSIMNTYLAHGCATAVSMLDEEDRDNIDSFTGICENGIITCTLVLADGTTIQGQLNNG
jgi:hypothetical protein